jgi:hypothetical protein
MTENKLEIGEKYLSVQIMGSINVSAFKVKDKPNPNYPDFKGNGIAIWIKEKRPEKEPERPKEEFI